MTTAALASASAGPGIGGLRGWGAAVLLVALLSLAAWWAVGRRRR
ncbi:hypothetical protein [Phycicoccus sp.]|nr:hypothetical protein [Phycicoccus sp.]HMM94702.1 hypothetical protein [Phycicoccus sp.]